MSKQVFERQFAGRRLQVETGQLAKQANGSVLVRYGKTTVLAVAVMSQEASSGDFFPLQVHYEEKRYAAGKFPGGFTKREGRPSPEATLIARLIDRPIRPLFAAGFRHEVQVITTVLSYEEDASPAFTALLGASLALSISDIPFLGPVAGVEMAYQEGTFICNPSPRDKKKSLLDLTLAGTQEAINMVEAGADELPESTLLQALEQGHAFIQDLVAFQDEIVAAVGKNKQIVSLVTGDDELKKAIARSYADDFQKALSLTDTTNKEEAIYTLKDKIVAAYQESVSDEKTKDIEQVVEEIISDNVRHLIMTKGQRPDGRKLEAIRPLSSEVDKIPQVHGSGLFTRGETQVLSVLTLAPMSETQLVDGLFDDYPKRFMHHYNFPQYAVGATGRYGAATRREIGHGALGERALERVLPSLEDFPYAIRLVSEVLSSNGSSSQASICAGSLALMAGGVPLKAPVAGIAMGLITDGDDYAILTDIQGLEDHFGDMDFKVAGTTAGITALQMDIKIAGITPTILREALEQAKNARLEILTALEETIKEPRSDLAVTAPRIGQLQIAVDKIKVVIGKGGETIDKIIAETGVKIDIDDSGQVYIYSDSQAAIDRTKAIIEDLVREAKVGDVYRAKVVRIEPFGAFVNLFDKTDALVHITEIGWSQPHRVEEVLEVGEEVDVKIIKVDDRGRVDASMRALFPNPKTHLTPKKGV